MDLSTITVAQFKARFNRDFSYVQVPDGNYVMDQDITNAYEDAMMDFNQALFGSDVDITNAYLALSAHFLAVNLKAASGGINGGVAMPVSSRSVGSVSESYAIPAAYTEDPYLAQYTSTAYGMRYLALVLPRIVGNMQAVIGMANP